MESLACPPSLLTGPGFADLTGGVHDEAIACLSGLDDTFRASLPVTPAQFASLIGRAVEEVLGIGLPDAPGRFADVAGPPHARAIERLAELSVLRATTDQTFARGRA